MSRGISPILLVEDDDILAGLLVEILGRLGQVVWSASAEDAEERLSSQQWDLIVADVELPGRTGIEVVERAKAQHPLCSTLIVSGRSSFDYAVGAIRAGADDYLTKPLDPEAFLEKARELLGRTLARREKGRVSVLAVGAHPDDPEIGVGGILLNHAAQGHSVAVLTLTGGEQGGVQSQRAEESKRAADLLGARLCHKELVDTSLTDGGDTISAIKDLVNDTLELERLDAGRMELDRRPSALEDVAKTALHAVDALAGAAGVSLVSTVGGIRLLADPTGSCRRSSTCSATR